MEKIGHIFASQPYNRSKKTQNICQMKELISDT